MYFSLYSDKEDVYQKKWCTKEDSV